MEQEPVICDVNCCHGQFEGMLFCSEPANLSRRYRLWWRIKTAVANASWHLKNEGLWTTIKLMVGKIQKLFGIKINKKKEVFGSEKELFCKEVLGLQPGEIVEVRSEQEIPATLDKDRKNKGLLWMAGMNRFCGNKFRVYKRLELILLESNGEHRKMKNTVLLDGVLCDGKAFNGCDRSCFHYWREVWLKRVEEKDNSF